MASGFEYIASTGSPVGVSTLSFTSVPNTYDSLVLRGYCCADNSAEQEGYIRFNGDNTTGNYSRNFGGRYGTISAQIWQGSSHSNFTFVPGSGIPTYGGSIVSQVDMNIFAYRKDSTVPGAPGMMSQSNYHALTTGYNSVQFLFSVWYKGDNTVDVTSIELLISNGNWGAQTKFHLYGRSES